MLFGSLFALLPALAVASAATIPVEERASPLGRLHPSADLSLCVAVPQAAVGATATLVSCHADSDAASSLELWNITSAPFNMQLISLQSDPTLCLDGTVYPNQDRSVTLQTCGTNTGGGQKWSYSTDGFLSMPNAFCLRKVGTTTTVNLSSCYAMTSDLEFFAS
ncbi:hypothetical protein IAT38_003900 [Cryptococcus sp. DSM 104549]